MSAFVMASQSTFSPGDPCFTSPINSFLHRNCAIVSLVSSVFTYLIRTPIPFYIVQYLAKHICRPTRSNEKTKMIGLFRKRPSYRGMDWGPYKSVADRKSVV